MKKSSVLGIDPGLDRTGWAVLEGNGAAGFVLQACGLIHTDLKSPLPVRLEQIYTEISNVAAQFKTDGAAMEEMFFLKRAVRVAHTVQARGVILLALHQQGLQVSSYQPKQVKAALCGSGAADKKQMQRMVQLTLKLKNPLNPDDVADAAAIAVCHLKTAPVKAKINIQQQFLEKLKAAKQQQIKKITK